MGWTSNIQDICHNFFINKKQKKSWYICKYNILQRMSQFINKNTVNSGDKNWTWNHTFNLSLSVVKSYRKTFNCPICYWKRQNLKKRIDKNRRFVGKHRDFNTINDRPLWSFGSFHLIVISTHDFTYNIQAQHTHKPLQLYRYQTQYVDYLWSEQHICSEMNKLFPNWWCKYLKTKIKCLVVL